MTSADFPGHVLTEKLADAILFAPLHDGAANRIAVLSGYATPTMASWYLKKLEDRNIRAQIELLVGMTPESGLSKNVHEGFIKIQSTVLQKFIVDSAVATYQTTTCRNMVIFI